MADIEENLVQIQENGFTVLRGQISASDVAGVLQFAKEFSYKGEQSDLIQKRVQRLNKYADNIYNVVSKRPDFLNFFISGSCGILLSRLLNDPYYTSIPECYPNYIIRSMLLRSSRGKMPWHIDSFIPYSDGPVSVVQASIFLERSYEENGATVLVRGSHLSGKYAPQGLESDAILLEADPGDIAIWDSRTWHATTENVTTQSRWALISTFTRWYIKQGFDYPQIFKSRGVSDLTVEQQIVLGLCSSVPLDEFEKTEVKGGLDSLDRFNV